MFRENFKARQGNGGNQPHNYRIAGTQILPKSEGRAREPRKLSLPLHSGQITKNGCEVAASVSAGWV